MNRANQRLSERTTNIQSSIRSTVSQPIFLWLFAQTRAGREDRRKYLRRTCWPTEIVFASARRTRSATHTSTSFRRYQTDTVVIFRVTLKHSSFSVGRGQRLSDIYKTSTGDLEAVDFAIYAVNESR